MTIFGKKGPSGFSATSTAEEVTRGIDATGLTAIVTGASNGIGVETMRVLVLRGAHVVMAVKNKESGNNFKEAILKEIPDAKLDVMELDLSSSASVRKFAEEYISLRLPLNILINNAGTFLNHPFKLSEDKMELRFATNHLGHFLLKNILLENMKQTSRESSIEGRLVNVSSDAHTHAYPEGIRFDTINEKKSRCMRSYAESKFANILHANELSRRLKEEQVQITVNSLHPGLICTNIARDSIPIKCLVNLSRLLFLSKTIQQGVATTCFVALNPQVKGVSGKYYADCNVAKPSSQARDADLAKKLWDFSLSLTNLK